MIARCGGQDVKHTELVPCDTLEMDLERQTLICLCVIHKVRRLYTSTSCQTVCVYVSTSKPHQSLFLSAYTL